VLIVEDNTVNLRVATMVLKRAGWQTDSAGDGVEALEKTAEGDFDLILMDCHMPRMDGIEATRALRERGDTTPVVALTANASQEERERCIAAGMDDFVSKPFDHGELVALLDRRLATRTG